MDNKKILNKKINELKKLKWKKLKFILYHEPIASKRPRIGFFKNFYVPDAEKNKKKIRNEIIPYLDKNFKLIYTDIKINIISYSKIPKYFSKVDTELAELKYIRPIVKPDIDNIIKAYLDALNKFIWHDDSQIISCKSSMYYSKKPRVKIIIYYKTNFSSNFYKNRKKRLK